MAFVKVGDSMYRGEIREEIGFFTKLNLVREYEEYEERTVLEAAAKENPLLRKLRRNVLEAILRTKRAIAWRRKKERERENPNNKTISWKNIPNKENIGTYTNLN